MVKKPKPFTYHKIAFGEKSRNRIWKNLNTAYDKGVLKSFSCKSVGKTSEGNNIYDLTVTQRKPKPKTKKRK